MSEMLNGLFRNIHIYLFIHMHTVDSTILKSGLTGQPGGTILHDQMQNGVFLLTDVR
jgi:hypothetical protein